MIFQVTVISKKSELKQLLATMLMLHLDFAYLLPDPTHNIVISFLRYNGNPRELMFGILDFDGGNSGLQVFPTPVGWICCDRFDE